MDSQSQPGQTPVLQRKERGFLSLGNPTSQSADTSLVRLKHQACDRKIHRLLIKSTLCSLVNVLLARKGLIESD